MRAGGWARLATRRDKGRHGQPDDPFGVFDIDAVICGRKDCGALLGGVARGKLVGLMLEMGFIESRPESDGTAGTWSEYRFTRHAARRRRRAAWSVERHIPKGDTLRELTPALPSLIVCPSCQLRQVIDAQRLELFANAQGAAIDASQIQNRLIGDGTAASLPAELRPSQDSA